jgi:hypothetical protein
MEIGTIGAGAFAQAFGKQALKAGHKVKLSNRHGPDSLRETVNQLGPGATTASREEAAACEMVLLAVPWDDVPETLASLPEWKNRGAGQLDQLAAHFGTGSIISQPILCGHVVRCVGNGTQLDSRSKRLYLRVLQKRWPILSGERSGQWPSSETLLTPVD